MIRQFFEIFNFRFWLLLFEILFIPMGMMIGGLIFCMREKGSEDEIQ